jgi:hypothetical protein
VLVLGLMVVVVWDYDIPSLKQGSMIR